MTCPTRPTRIARIAPLSLLLCLLAVSGCESNSRPQFSQQTLERYPNLAPPKSGVEQAWDSTASFTHDAVVTPSVWMYDNLWPFKPGDPLDAARVEVTRFRMTKGPDGKAAPVGVQTMSLDLASGRSAITDVDGRTYPYQVPPTESASIRTSLADRAFLNHGSSAAKGAVDPLFYELTVVPVNPDQKLVRHRFATPPGKPLPAALASLVDTFDRADRTLHPIAGQVNLLN